MELQGKKILVTGGGGFVGSHIVDKLLSEKVARITILDNFIRGTPVNLSHVEKNPRVEIVNGDIRDQILVNTLMKDVDYVFHQAAIRLLTCTENPRLCNEVMVDGTFNVLEAAVFHKTKKIVMASSVSVYGEPSFIPIAEDHPYNNATVYGAAKIANEHMAKAFSLSFGLPIVVLRYFNVYGPRMDIRGAHREVLIKWLEKIDEGENLVIHGDGKQALDFVYVEDVAKANIQALKSNTQFGIYNVGTGKTTSLSQLAALLISMSNKKVETIFEKTITRPNVSKRQAEISLAQKDLGFTAEVTLEEGLRKLISWRKERLSHIE